ncbi:MAG: hypothetical protein ABI867_44045 [Kofleriaceae bacterium]
MGDHELPVATLRPRNRHDRVALLRVRARIGARAAAAVFTATAKAFLLVAACGAGLALIGAAGSVRSRPTRIDMSQFHEQLRMYQKLRDSQPQLYVPMSELGARRQVPTSSR